MCVSALLSATTSRLNCLQQVRTDGLGQRRQQVLDVLREDGGHGVRKRRRAAAACDARILGVRLKERSLRSERVTDGAPVQDVLLAAVHHA